MSHRRISRRLYYAAVLAEARAATWADMGGRSLVVGIAISLAAGLLYLVLTGNQDDPVLGVLAILIAALALFGIVFTIHIVLTPPRLHQRMADGWVAASDSMIEEWKKSNRETLDNWRESNRETIESWTASNDSLGYAIRRLALSGQIDAAKGLREHLAASERAEAADDGELRAMVDSWDGSTTTYIQGISEAEREFYLRESAVPASSGRTWQQELRDFIVLRDGRLEEIYNRYEDRKL